MSPPKKEIMQIGEVAKRADTTIRTVRYYLHEGMISAVQRSKGGFYLFDANIVDKVRYICHLRELGLSLSNIKHLIEIRRKSKIGGTASSLLRARLEEQLEFTEKKIEEYLELKRELSETIRVLEKCADCKGKPKRSVCGQCSVLQNYDKLPSPMKAVY